MATHDPKRTRMTEDGGHFSGWYMAIIAFLAMNCGIGIAFGGYGTLVTTLQAEFNTSRALASAGLAFVSAGTGVVAPIVGWMLQKTSLRLVMAIGAACNIAGYLILVKADSIYMVLAIYALLIGPGVAALTIIPSMSLISRWFVRDRGKVLGAINLQIFLFMIPMLDTFLLSKYGLHTVFLSNAAVFAMLLVPIYFIIDSPEAVGQQARGANDAPSGREKACDGTLLTTRSILRSWEFWCLSIGVGFVSGAATIVITHAVALITGHGIALAAASVALAAYGVGASAGSFVWGWVADRLGSPLTLIVVTVAAIPAWIGLTAIEPNPLGYVLLIGWLGLCLGGLPPLHAGTIADLFGRANLSPVLGLSYMLKLPFLVTAAPLAGLLFDITGSYNAILMGMIAGLAVMAGLFAIIRYKSTNLHMTVLA